MKPIIKPFDSGWNYIQHIIIKLISFLVIWSWKCGSMSRNKIASLQTLVNQVCNTVLNVSPQWISKPCIKNTRTIVKPVVVQGDSPKIFVHIKKQQFNECNCKSRRQNQRHTFMHHKSQQKTTSTDILYTSLKVKGETKIPFPCRQN